MTPPPIPADEAARMNALRSYEILDTEPEPQFDALVELAAHIAGVPMALVTLVDTDRQWFKARVGLDSDGSSREISFCGHAVASREALVVEDALDDERFVDNPFVTGDLKVRFYAGMPLQTPEGHVLGTLCTLDRTPRQLTPKQRELLGRLADQAVALLEARRRNIALIQRTRELAVVRATLDRTQDAICIVEPGTLRLSYVNDGAVHQLGYTREELARFTKLDLVPEAEQPRIRKALEAARAARTTVVTFETCHLARSGVEIPVEVVLQFVEDGTGAGRWISIARDISERRRVDRLQSEFISTVSHELRTPLTSIKGSLGLVAAGITGPLPEEAKEYVNIALSNSDRLVRLINDILDFEKMQSGKMEFRLQSVELLRLVQQAIAANAPTAQAQGAQLVLATTVPDVEVVVDPDRFAQVIANLVSNAAKFSPAEAPIEVSVTAHGDTVRLTVRDHGPGIPPDFAGRIFQRFAQAEASATRAKGGTGLGLSISKSIVERMHGAIGFEPAPGGGTCFYIELPALPRPAADDACPRILVVEDDPGVYRLITRALTSDGYRVDVAPTLERARRLLGSICYAAVTLDLAVADGDGAQLLSALRASGPPVIIVSGSDRDLSRASVLVADTVAKPFAETRLLEAIRRVVASCGKIAPRVLHVEDDEDVRRIVRRTLPEGWVVEGAESLAAGLQALASGSFDAVIIDLELPDGDGSELIAHVGAARVLIFSARDVEADLARRVSAALVKTRSTADDLRAVIASLVQQAPEGGPHLA